jgi:predicted DNA-binding protein (MmcQ/YjbR family)
MNIGDLLDFALSLPEVEESFPFGENVLVLKVKGKMFLAIFLNSIPLQFNAKRDHERKVSLFEVQENKCN